MTGDWKPGDVALVDFTGLGDWRVATYDDSGRYANWWWCGKVRDADMTKVRPLAVIDPEDRQAVERLLSLLEDRGWHVEEDSCQDLQAALREFAAPTPPRPNEPKGLGAVVEDIYGELWVRVDNYPEPWRVGNASHKWADIDVGRVLSEGIEQP